MGEMFEVVLYSLVAGITVFFGGLLSRSFEGFKQGVLKDEVVHTAVAFGGGVLIAAVSFVLAPKGIEALSIGSLIVVFLAGAFFFFLLDKLIERKGGTMAQLMAMLMDFLPEAIALGAVFAHNHRLGLLLAIFIGFQNLPEAFNSYTDLRKTGYTPNKCLSILFLLSFTGVFAALLGKYLLSGKTQLIAALMLFASGGILYLIFQDIAPLSKMKNHWASALGASFGFLVGIIGQKILG